MRWHPHTPGAPAPGTPGMSDAQVGAAHGVSGATVRRYRLENGIAAGHRGGRPRGSGSWSPDPKLVQPGAASDVSVAEAHGCSVSSVHRWRVARGIPAWKRTRRA